MQGMRALCTLARRARQMDEPSGDIPTETPPGIKLNPAAQVMMTNALNNLIAASNSQPRNQNAYWCVVDPYTVAFQHLAKRRRCTL